MRVADLAKAQGIVAARAVDIAMRDRLAAGETLTLMVGTGQGAGAVVLTSAYLTGIRKDVLGALDLRIAGHEAELAALGVQP